MKKRFIGMIATILLFIGFGVSVVHATENKDNFIGLHDKLLNFGQEEILLIEGNKFVPFDKLMASLYANVVYEDQVHAIKNNHIVSYDSKTGKTFVDYNEIKGSPIQLIEGKLFANVIFIAESYGFRIEYFSGTNLTRIFSDSYKT